MSASCLEMTSVGFLEGPLELCVVVVAIVLLVATCPTGTADLELAERAVEITMKSTHTSLSTSWSSQHAFQHLVTVHASLCTFPLEGESREHSSEIP